jgi:hypothetical protein
MISRSALLLAFSSFGAAFAAAPDLTPSISGPVSTQVESTGRYTVTVSNRGNASSASTSTVAIQLPVTATSPTVHVMGVLGAKSSNCTRSGTQLVCTVGSIRKGRSTSVWFDIALPESVDDLSFVATTSTTGDSNSGNNQATYTPVLTNPAVNFTPGDAFRITMCTGTNLSSFYECELYPSSQQVIEGIFHDDPGQSVSFTTPGGEGYGGTWATDGLNNYLRLNLTDELSDPAADFEGFGTPGDCWEGMTIFPGGGPYIAMYQVCIQP